MGTVAFTLIGRRRETLVPEAAEFRPFDWQALRQSYKRQGEICYPTVCWEEVVCLPSIMI
jgi:hypothetical protein